jgi:hypothetical protein
MKQYSKKLFSIIMLLSTAAITANAPYLQFRSQGRNNARKVVGETSYQTDLYNMESWYGTFDITLEYDRSFRPQSIANALFGPDLVRLPNTITIPTNNNTTSSSFSVSSNNSRAIVISGSQVPNRTVATDWMAENFLLPRNFQSVLTFSPLVQNILGNFDWYMGLDNWCSGLYFRLYGPVVNNRTNLRLSEVVINPGSNEADDLNFQPGFINAEGASIEQLFKRASDFFAGLPLTSISGVTFDPLMFAKMSSSKKSKTGFAELRGEFGWNWLRERYRFGFNIQTAAPTGTRPKGEFVLEPEIGNGKHWELGVGIKGLWSMWRSEDEEKHFDFIVEADITHLFKAKQRRTFDLIGKPNSRYMLAEKLVANGDANPQLDITSNPLAVQFSGEVSPVANFSTRNVKVSYGVQGDVVAMFSYTMRGFSWDLGYNFWGLSREKISLSSSSVNSTSSISRSNISAPFPEGTWALKGDASVAGELSTDVNQTVFLAATQNGATIHAGTNAAAVTNLVNADQNPGINNPVPATATFNGVSGIAVNVINVIPVEAINTSNPPVFIKATDLDFSGAKIRGFSNKIFTHFNYTWNECCDRWTPFVGLGASGEFGSHKNNHNNNSTSSIVNVVNNSSSSNSGNGNSNKFALSQWAIWIKGGVSFH